MRKVMLTPDILPTDEIIEVSKIKDRGVYDDRMEMVLTSNDIVTNWVTYYKNYVKSFCDAINRNPNCRPSYLAECGFLPIGVEPVVMCGTVNSIILTNVLRECGIEFFQVKPMSPIRSSYTPVGQMASSHDIWISKLDAAKIVNKPVWNITASDVLEVFL